MAVLAIALVPAAAAAASPAPGDWVGSYGADGYVLGAWNGNSDLVALPDGTSYSLEAGSRYLWTAATIDGRGVASPTGGARRMATWQDLVAIRIKLTFTTAYAGTLHLYGVDWDSLGRGQDVTVTDAAGPHAASMAAYSGGAWLHFPVAAPAGGSVVITATRTAGYNALLAGLFLGDAGTTPDPLPAHGDWTGSFGAGGYVLGGWNGATDLVALPADTTFTAERTDRYTWADSTTDPRALENAARTTRRAATWHDTTLIRLRLTFASGYSGDLHIYGVDWDGYSRRQDVTVDVAGATQTVAMGPQFVDGAWAHFRIDVPAGGSAVITATRTGSTNAVLSGLFLGDAVNATVPGAPRGLSATPGDADVTVRWSSGSTGGSPITSYTVTAAPGGATCSTAMLSCTVTGLTNGTTYSFSVTATNVVGTGRSSAAVSATPVTVPGAPTGLSAAAGNGSASLTWTAPASDGGSPVTGYTATVIPGGLSCTATALGCAISGLTNGIAYTFTVNATNAVGAGPDSAPATAQPFTVPSAATGLSATAGNRTATVSWTAAAANGASISQYTVTATPGGATCVTASTTCALTGLTNGTTYSFTVVATNAAGDGPTSQSVSATPTQPATVPDAPQGVDATARDRQIGVSWTAPASDGGRPVTRYTATVTPGGATCTTTSLACTISGLTNGTTYSVTVVATNSVGNSAAGGPVRATPAAPATVPGAPSTLVVTLVAPVARPAAATTPDVAPTLKWSPPASDGGSAITGYRIYRATVSGAEALLATVGNVTEYLDATAAPGTRYFYQVAALNSMGEGARSPEASTALVGAVPGAPRDLKAKMQASGHVALRWSAPKGPKTATVVGYRIYRSTSAGTETFLAAVATTTYLDTTTVRGVRYFYRVAAVTSGGEGALSREVHAGQPAHDRPHADNEGDRQDGDRRGS